MSKKLTVWLPDDWTNVENPGGPPTVRPKDPTSTGVVQVSVTEYKGGKEPRPSEADLVKFASNFGPAHQWGDSDQVSSGRCILGHYGTAVFKPAPFNLGGAPGFIQVWFLSNGLDFVFVTFIASAEPGTRELLDAQKIAEAINFA